MEEGKISWNMCELEGRWEKETFLLAWLLPQLYIHQGPCKILRYPGQDYRQGAQTFLREKKGAKIYFVRTTYFERKKG